MSDFDDIAATVSINRATTLDLRRATLQILSGPDSGKRFEIEQSCRIGARPLADVVLGDARVSGLHCEISVGEALRVRDLGSKNGTFVGPVRILDALLAPGDVVTVGETRMQVTPLSGTKSLPLLDADDFHGIVGHSAPIRALTARLAALAGGDTTVLVQGETGTGKERVAEALHLASKRAPKPQVVVDCGAMPSTMIESELFGHERGAFTGAVASVAGAFERAHGGTLFLDEVGELPLELQPKLLRALESRTVKRLGGAKPLAVDVRVVSATNRDLALEVAAGRFREDLYYRLAVVTLAVAPLRDRREDIPLLAARFLRDLGVEPAHFLTRESLEALMRHSWPGNVRELRNTLERSVALAEPLTIGNGSAAASPSPAGGPTITAATPPSIDLSVPLRVGRQRVVDAWEREYVTRLLEECGGNVSEASRRAGLERMSMYRLLHRLGFR
ncbi:MAG: sigma54 specific transcriptional regulator, Fis family [Myxococcales bacterium]|nr:sigma54 specific transcriptional regulator, Fis family [Myxococcales bacterium]